MATTYDPIATTTLGSAAATITFSSIAASWTDLKLIFVGTGTASIAARIRFNSDSASNYSFTGISGNGSTVSVGNDSNATVIDLGYATNLSTTIPSFYEINIFSYAGSTYKTVLASMSNDFNGSGSTNRAVYLWRSTSAINNISITSSSSTFAAGTTATLYGIKSA